MDHASFNPQLSGSFAAFANNLPGVFARGQMDKKLPGNIYRCKRVIFSVEDPERRAVLQVVGRRADVSLYDEWGDLLPRTQIVAIGSPQGIDSEDLDAKLDACIIENKGVFANPKTR